MFMNKYKEILSEIESESDLSEDISDVVARAKKIRDRRRQIGTACIALAVVLTTSVAAVAAAHNPGIKDGLRNIDIT